MPSYMAKQERLVNQLSEGFSNVNDQVADDEVKGDSKEQDKITPQIRSELNEANITSPTPLKEKKKK